MKHPDFNEWLKTTDGESCNNMSNLTGQPYLQNRLFWAFDAGRNCVWEQMIQLKSDNEKLIQKLKEFDKPINEV